MDRLVAFKLFDCVPLLMAHVPSTYMYTCLYVYTYVLVSICISNVSKDTFLYFLEKNKYK